MSEEMTHPSDDEKLVEELETLANSLVTTAVNAVMLRGAATRLRELTANCLPELPSGYSLLHLKQNDGTTYSGNVRLSSEWECAIHDGPYVRKNLHTGEGPTPRAAILAALAKIGDGK